MNRNYKILVVDDEQAILSMVKMHLELEGYLVMTASAYSTFECSGSYIIGYQYAGDEWD